MRNDPSTLQFREDGTPFYPQGAEPQAPVVDAELAALLLPLLVEAFGEALTACELRLFALANQDDTAEARERREALARELYRQREQILGAFREHLAAQREPGAAQAAGGLRLADERHEAELAFGLLLSRAARLMAAEAVADFPFAMASLATALKAALGQVSLPVEAELLLYKFLERRLLSRLPQLLGQARQQLERSEAAVREIAEELRLDFGSASVDLNAALPEALLPQLEGLSALSLEAPAAAELPLPELEPEDEAGAEELELVWPLFRVLSSEKLAQEIRAPLWTLVSTLSQASPEQGRHAGAVKALEAWLDAGVSHPRAERAAAQVMLANLVLEQVPLLCQAFREGMDDFIAALGIYTRVLNHWLPAPEVALEILPEAIPGPQDFLADTVALASEDAPDFQRLQEEARERRALEPQAPKDWRQWLAARADAPAQTDHLKTLAALAPGDWLSFSGAGLANLRCKIVAHIQGPERYLLCDWRGRKLAEATPAQLSLALAEGVLSLDILSLRMEKPLEMLMGALKQRRE